MPRNNGAAAKERRRQAAVARAGQVVTVEPEPGWLPVLSREELAAVNSAAAAEKASHPEGGGHADPELTEAGLSEVRHISRWVRAGRGFELRTDGKRCPIGAASGCLDCVREVTDGAVTAQLHRAQGDLREKRFHEARKIGLAMPKRKARERPTG